uniref:Putative conserved protein with signal anchor n=1 Tax=Ixodes ricinus TaxID=34613 RepID=A0A6B0UK34_IXORI
MQPSSVSYRKTPCQILRSNSMYIFNKLASKLSNEPSRRNLPTLACDMRRNRQRSQCDIVGAANVKPIHQRHDYIILAFCFLLHKAKENDDIMSFSSWCWLNSVHVITVRRMR